MARSTKFNRKSRQYLAARSEAKSINARKEALSKELKELLELEGIDSSGHKVIEFDEPVEVDGKKVKGLKRTRKVSTSIDENIVEEILENHPDIDRSKVFVKVEYEELDQNALFVLNQDKVISDDELDQIFVDNVYYSLDVIE